jgi:hypothetical protein
LAGRVADAFANADSDANREPDAYCDPDARGEAKSDALTESLRVIVYNSLSVADSGCIGGATFTCSGAAKLDVIAISKSNANFNYHFNCARYSPCSVSGNTSGESDCHRFADIRDDAHAISFGDHDYSDTQFIAGGDLDSDPNARGYGERAQRVCGRHAGGPDVSERIGDARLNFIDPYTDADRYTGACLAGDRRGLAHLRIQCAARTKSTHMHRCERWVGERRNLKSYFSY